MNGTDPEGFSAKDPLKGSEFLVDDCVVLVQVGILATRSTSVTYEKKTFLYFHIFEMAAMPFPCNVILRIQGNLPRVSLVFT